MRRRRHSTNTSLHQCCSVYLTEGEAGATSGEDARRRQAEIIVEEMVDGKWDVWIAWRFHACLHAELHQSAVPRLLCQQGPGPLISMGVQHRLVVSGGKVLQSKTFTAPRGCMDAPQHQLTFTCFIHSLKHHTGVSAGFLYTFTVGIVHHVKPFVESLILFERVTITVNDVIEHWGLICSLHSPAWEK